VRLCEESGWIVTEQGAVFRLIYSSHSTIPPEQRQGVLANIFDVARSKNKRAGVTGALLVTDHWFVQTLEGDEATVTALFEQIRGDTRHERVSVVETGFVGERTFPRWSMAQVSKSGHADIPLHNVGGRIHSAARVNQTEAQRALLTRMRNVIGADTV
jgi:hypothetical protein